MSSNKNPLSRLNHRELVWLAGILKDACRERLEKNQVSQAFEARLHERGYVEGRPDPRPFLKIWEPRYRKFLEVATELHALLESEGAQVVAESLRARFDFRSPSGSRQDPGSTHVMIEENAANPGRKSRSR